MQRAKSLYAATQHPITVIFHVGFKVIPIVLYLLMGWGIIGENFVVQFIVLILLESADFWITKNISGRMLVGLRWWHYVNPDGSNVWVFESSKEQGTIVNSIEGVIFWGALVGAVPIWIIFAIVNIFGLKFQYLFVVIVSIILLGANIFGYAKCIKDKKTQLRKMAVGYIANKVAENAMAGTETKEEENAFPI
eukprot:TRINITY_DN14729_c0_g1_i2.p1 TRINITY_DN14729_c0_g1~~TRINITY_DN14729_c0_g1_i2.p1  ORF type:complete len:193 (+),score=26.69 TRINITY_DN14729_c0_g1_i2:20-598(+)